MTKSLIVKLGAIGDVVLSLPAVEALREEHPNDSITFLTGEASAPLLEKHPALNRLWTIDENIFWKKRMISLLRLGSLIRRERYDRVYILHWSPWFHRFFQMLGIPERWGFNRDGTTGALTHQVPYVEADSSAHDASQYLAAVSDHFVIGPKAQRVPHLYLTDDEKTWAQKEMQGHFLPITIAPGGGNNPKLFMPQKRWLPERFHELAERLIREEKATLFVVGDASETYILRDLAQRYPEDVRILAGRISLRQTAAAIGQSRLFIGNDSGLFHVASAVGTPVVAFFGPTSPNGKIPSWMSHMILYTSEECSPCYKHGVAPPCPYELRCMQNISIQQAFAAAQDLLHASAKSN